MTETQKQVIAWLAVGEAGASSRCMAMWLAFGQRTGSGFEEYPHDPGDMDRCLKLLQHAPGLRETLPKMAQVGKVWASLVARWTEIESTQLDEIGIDWKKARSAPKTYALMREIIDGAHNLPATSSASSS